MSQNEPLTTKQLNVIELLVAESSVSQTSKETAVGRSTIHRWCRENGEFQAAINAARKARFNHHVQALETLATSAIENVTRAIEQDGDLKTSLIVLDKLGLLAPHSIGPDDTDDLATIRLQAEAERAHERSLAELRTFASSSV